MHVHVADRVSATLQLRRLEEISLSGHTNIFAQGANRARGGDTERIVKPNRVED